MTKQQRFRYEMLARIRDFAKAIAGVIPSGSTVERRFAQVATAVSAIEEHLKKRDLARADGRRVKATTRQPVQAGMRAIARTARRLTTVEAGPTPFVLPQKRSNTALLTAARNFIDEAKRREASFVEYGMPPTFLADFTQHVDRLEEAVEIHNNGRSWRTRAQTGIEAALDDGTAAVRDLDVMVPNVLASDPVALGHWRGARHLSGNSPSGAHRPAGQVSPANPPTTEGAQPPAAGDGPSSGATLTQAS